MNTFLLNNGIDIPAIGLGTFPMKRYELVATVRKAIKNNYLLFDTANAYGNEKFLGLAIKLTKKKREDLFVTTKLSNSQQRNGNIRKSLKDSLKLLRLDYIDLYLMHWPNPDTFLESWKQMEILYEEGLCKAIGVCNFHQHHLEQLLKIANVIPSVNQIELHPLLSQKLLIEYCKSKNILVQAYSPLARMHEDLIFNPVITSLSKKYEKTAVQIILRWIFQQGISSVPKTSTNKRLKSNINIFDFKITDIDMDLINQINKNFRVRYNPDNCDFNKL